MIDLFLISIKYVRFTCTPLSLSTNVLLIKEAIVKYKINI